MKITPTLELAHGELPDHQHVGLAVVESRAGDTINLQTARPDSDIRRGQEPQPFLFGRRHFEEIAQVVNVSGKPDLAKVKEIMLRHGLVSA
jgi:hypothetical protein